jgi:hypothetical protein
MFARRWPLLALVAWSAFVWLTRISNARGDTEASASTKAWAYTLSASMLVLAVASLVVVIRSSGRSFVPSERSVVRLFAGWTVVVWVVRGVEIAFDDHSLAFKIVHIVLGVISIALAALTWRTTAVTTEASGPGPAGEHPAVGSPGREPAR